MPIDDYSFQALGFPSEGVDESISCIQVDFEQICMIQLKTRNCSFVLAGCYDFIERFKRSPLSWVGNS